MVMTFLEPKLVFRRHQTLPLVVEYGMAHYPGCFTLTGVLSDHLFAMFDWCRENSCGHTVYLLNQIHFEDESQMLAFLLRWS